MDSADWSGFSCDTDNDCVHLMTHFRVGCYRKGLARPEKNISDAVFFSSYKSSGRGQGNVKTDVEALVFLQPRKMQQNREGKSRSSLCVELKMFNDHVSVCTNRQRLKLTDQRDWRVKKKKNSAVAKISTSKLNNLRLFSFLLRSLKKAQRSSQIQM